MTKENLENALEKQIPPGSEFIAIDAGHGLITLDGDLGLKVASILRKILKFELKKQEDS